MPVRKSGSMIIFEVVRTGFNKEFNKKTTPQSMEYIKNLY